MHGFARLCEARCCLAMLANKVMQKYMAFLFLIVIYTYNILSWLGNARRGFARQGIARLGIAKLGIARLVNKVMQKYMAFYFLQITYIYYIISRRGNAGHCLVRHCLARLAKGHVFMHGLLFLFVTYIYYIISRLRTALRGFARLCEALLGIARLGQ